MAENLSSSFNPWSTGSSVVGIQLGDPQSGLTIARRHGLASLEEDDDVRNSLSNSSSIRMTSTLQEMSALSTELNEVIELEFHKRTKDKEMANVMHLDIMKARLAKITSMLDHLTSVVTNKELIMCRLQSKAAENSLIIEAPYQRHAAEVLSSLGTFVSQLPTNCDKAKQSRSLDLDKTILNEKISEAAQGVVQCKVDLQTCQQLHDILERS